MKGSLYFQAHHPGREGSYGLQPWLHGRRCKVTALSTGLPCKRAVMRGYDACASHGGNAGEGSKAIMAAPYDPVAAANRQAKRTRHRVYTQLRATSRAPKPVQESFQRFERRLDRERRAEASLFSTERQFREHRGAMRHRTTLYRWVEDETEPPRKLPPLYPA